MEQEIENWNFKLCIRQSFWQAEQQLHVKNAALSDQATLKSKQKNIITNSMLRIIVQQHCEELNDFVNFFHL